MLNELLKFLAKGPDNALLRFSIGSNYLAMGEIDQAQMHLKKAVELDPNYSAAWKLYGKALWQNGDTEAADDVFVKGIKVATDRGDIQAVREMEVFLKRLQKGVGE